MPRRNRVDPWGDLHAVDARGMFTGNRGCLVDSRGRVVRHHRGDLWIICQTEFRGRRVGLARPKRWTPIFFLDDAVALAAGHRPCGECRRDAYRAYAGAAAASLGATRPLSPAQMNRQLAAERLGRGSGVSRAADRLLWQSPISALPVGTVIVDDAGAARLVLDDRLVAFDFDGWTDPVARPRTGDVAVLTPPLSVTALANGFTPELHPSAALV